MTKNVATSTELQESALEVKSPVDLQKNKEIKKNNKS
jgi:hypothetical protein